MTPHATPAGVLLMTFGSANTAAGVRTYLESVRGGRAAPDDVIAEFERRYAAVGRSPLVDITHRQAALLQDELQQRAGSASFRVEAGMLHSAPRIADAVQRLLQDGVRSIIAVTLAPQYSSLVLAGYERAIAAERAAHPDVSIRIAGPWYDVPEWIDSLALRVRLALRQLDAGAHGRVPVIFTAHSLPRHVVERDPSYIEQLRDTARAAARSAGIAEDRWQFAYQSAGHSPEEWLRPDVKELLPALRAAGHTTVVVAPVQFVADHLEVLYDIDIAAVDEARTLGVRLVRIAMPNTEPALIAALAAVVERERVAVAP